MKWVSVNDRLPNPDDGLRVLIYTEDFDFAGQQFFDVEAESLNEFYYRDPETQPKECRCASHWMPLPYPKT